MAVIATTVKGTTCIRLLKKKDKSTSFRQKRKEPQQETFRGKIRPTATEKWIDKNTMF